MSDFDDYFEKKLPLLKLELANCIAEIEQLEKRLGHLRQKRRVFCDIVGVKKNASIKEIMEAKGDKTKVKR